jgi:hypothetical protein
MPHSLSRVILAALRRMRVLSPAAKTQATAPKQALTGLTAYV